MTTSTSRRAVLASAAALPALSAPTLAAPPADASLIALGERFEVLLLEHFDASLIWAPALRAAHRETDARFGDVEDEERRRWFERACTRHGVADAAASMEAASTAMEPIAEEIKSTEASSVAGLRAKALVVLSEALPAFCDHEGTLGFADDGDASEALFRAVAQLTGLRPLVDQIEQQLAADAEVQS